MSRAFPEEYRDLSGLAGLLNTKRRLLLVGLIAVLASSRQAAAQATDDTSPHQSVQTVSGGSGGIPAVSPEARQEFAWVLDQLEILRDGDSTMYRLARSAVVFMGQRNLASLGFGPAELSGETDGATRRAVETYEAARHLEITGDMLSPSVWPRLAMEAERVRRFDLTYPPKAFAVDGWDQGFVTASGALVTEGAESLAEAVFVECVRARSECSVVSNQLVRGERVIRLSVPVREAYPIESWGAAELVSEPVDVLCTSSRLRLDRERASLVITRSPRRSAPADVCHEVSREAIASRLVSASEASIRDEYWLRLLNLSPQLRELFDDFRVMGKSRVGAD